jgi:hypothetical protein
MPPWLATSRPDSRLAKKYSGAGLGADQLLSPSPLSNAMAAEKDTGQAGTGMTLPLSKQYAVGTSEASIHITQRREIAAASNPASIFGALEVT